MWSQSVRFVCYPYMRATRTTTMNDSTDRETSERRSSHDAPFSRRIVEPSPSKLVDDILPLGTLLEFVSVDVLNGYINYVDLLSVITERDPDEEERHISISNRFYTHFHEFGTVIHVVAASKSHLWYFCYDIDASDCAVGRVDAHGTTLQEMIDWVRRERISGRYPVVEIDIKKLTGWRSFQ